MKRRTRNEIWRVTVLVLVTILLWFLIYRRLPGKDWAPVAYGGGDEALIYATVKAVHDGEIGLFGSKQVARLGAPFVANWNDFPSSEDFLYFITGQISKVTGVVAAVDAAYLLAIILAAASFYLVGRYMRWRWELCFAGAVLYGWSYYMTHRSVPHFNLVFYWPCPLWLLVCWWTASRRGIEFQTRRFWFSMLVVLFTAWNNQYYMVIFLQLLALAMLAHVVRRYPIRTLAAPLCLGLVCVALVILMILDTLLYQAHAGVNSSAVVRHLSDVERYCLKPIDLFLPYSHRIEAIERFVRSYAATALLNGEVAMTYLGIIGGAALLSMWGSAFYQILLGRRGVAICGLTRQSIWLMCYSVCGGLSIIPALFGFYLLRASNRVSIVLLTLALFFAVRAGSRLARTWSRRMLVLSCVLIVAFGIWDQTPAYAREQVNALVTKMKMDRLFIQRFERDLPQGAMIFQLPVIRSQEANTSYHMAPYDHFRPYIFSNSLHFSHGDDFGRAPDEWRAAVARLHPANMAAQLESHGFSGMLIDRDAYQDGGKELISKIRQFGREPDWNREHNTFLFVRLHPAALARKPTLPPLFAKGWYDQESKGEDVWHWSEGDARIEFRRPSPDVAKTDVTFDLQTITPRTVRIATQGQVLKDVVLKSATTDQRVTLSFKWEPTETSRWIEFSTNTPPLVSPTGDRRSLSIRVANLEQTPPAFPE